MEGPPPLVHCVLSAVNKQVFMDSGLGHPSGARLPSRAHPVSIRPARSSDPQDVIWEMATSSPLIHQFPACFLSAGDQHISAKTGPQCTRGEESVVKEGGVMCSREKNQVVGFKESVVSSASSHYFFKVTSQRDDTSTRRQFNFFFLVKIQNTFKKM